MSKSIVVLYYDQDIANGGFYDNFEYYYILRKYFGSNVNLVYATDHTEEDCIVQLKDKYENIEEDIWNGIQFVSHLRGKLYKKNKVDIVFSAISASLIWFIRHKNILVADQYIGLCDIPELIPASTYYRESKLLYDERVFNSKGRYEPYRKKILFDKYRIKKFGNKHDYMINLALAERRYSKEFIINLINQLPKGSSIGAYIDSKNKEYYSWLTAFNKTDYFKEDNNRIIIYEPPIKNFMSLFKTFIYIPYTDGHDSTPRLIPECKFYGKDILMKTEGFKISGGYFRYKDTQNDFESLWLKEDDIIIDIIKEALNNV
jgi:hypothetical protein